MARCEELLKQYASSSTPAQPPPPLLQHPGLGQSPVTPVAAEPGPDASDSTPMSVDTPQNWKPACKMVNEEGGVRFMDSYTWASVYEEL